MSLLFSSFLLTGSSFAQNPPAAAADAPAAPAAPAVAAPETAVKPHHEHEHHPELRKAMRRLRDAKRDLEKATHDYDGHKAKAIEAINSALEELKAAVDSDKK